MKLSFQLLILLLSVSILQGCNSKSKEATAEEVLAKAKAKKDSLENAAKADRDVKRTKLEKEIADKAERRRLAAIEKASKSESYKKCKGKDRLYQSRGNAFIYRWR